jgi:hypothetical protein
MVSFFFTQIMKIGFHILRTILSVLSFLIGFYMLETIDYSEIALVDNGWSTWFLAPYFIRIVSGLFMFTGLVFLFALNHSKKMLVWPFGLFLFSTFFQCSIIWQIELDRCYLCLRELFQWNIYQGLFLGGFGLLLVILLYNLPHVDFNWKFRYSIIVTLLIVCISIPFILNYPANWAIYGESASEEIQKPLQLERLDSISTPNQFGKIPSALNEGKQLIAFVTLTCPYCKRAAYKLHVLKKKYPLAPITILTSGNAEDWELFYKRTKIVNIPHALLNHPIFAELTEGSVPRIYLVDDGVAIQKVQYWAIDQEFLEKNLN